MNEKRVLCIVYSMDTGGSETILMKIYRQIVAYNIKLDFIVLSNKKGFYNSKIPQNIDLISSRNLEQ